MSSSSHVVLTSRFKYTKANKAVGAASMIPLAHKPFVQFLSIPVDVLRARIEKESIKNPMYTLTFVPNGEGDMGTECDSDPQWYPEDYHSRGRGRVKVEGPLAWKWRCK